MRLSLVLSLVAVASASAQSGLTGTIIITNKQPSTATIIDAATGRHLATLPTGAGPHEIVMTQDARLAVVTDYGGAPRKTLTVIDVPGMKVLRTIDLGTYTAPHGIAFLPGDSVVAVTSESTGNVVLVNINQGVVSRAIATEGVGSHMVGVTADGARGYTGNMRSNTVSELDMRDGRFLRSLPVPTTPEAINVTADGKEVWVGSNSTGKLTVVDVGTWTATTAAEGFQWPYRVWFTPDHRTVIVPDMTNENVRFFDRASRREIGQIALPGAGPQGITVTPNGRFILLSLSKQGKIAVIDVATRKVIQEIPAGLTPDGIVYTARVLGR
jgi:YVTN family beta-propeller protein